MYGHAGLSTKKTRARENVLNKLPSLCCACAHEKETPFNNNNIHIESGISTNVVLIVLRRGGTPGNTSLLENFGP